MSAWHLGWVLLGYLVVCSHGVSFEPLGKVTDAEVQGYLVAHPELLHDLGELDTDRIEAISQTLPDYSKVLQSNAFQRAMGEALSVFKVGSGAPTSLSRGEPIPDLLTAPVGVDIVFLSSSMPRDMLIDILNQSVRERHPPLFALRGLVNDEGSIEQTQQWIQGLLNAFRASNVSSAAASDPLVLLHPRLFSRYQVEQVPVRIRLDADGHLAYRLPGGTTEYQIEKQIQDSLATHGTGVAPVSLLSIGRTWPIAERDLFELIQARLNRFDFQSRQQALYRDFWQDYAFVELPTSYQAETLVLDPTLLVTDNIDTPQGERVARQGDTFNPLERVPFTRHLIVFDATDPRQTLIATKLMRQIEAAQPEAVIKIIVTRFDLGAGDGHDAYRKLTNDLGRHVYLLQVNLRDAFGLSRIPAYIRADEQAKRLLVSYFNVLDQ